MFFFFLLNLFSFYLETLFFCSPSGLYIWHDDVEFGTFLLQLNAIKRKEIRRGGENVE